MFSFGCVGELSGFLALAEEMFAIAVPLFGIAMVSSCFMLAIGANNEQYHRFQRRGAFFGLLGLVAAGAGYGFVQVLACLEVGKVTISGFLVMVFGGVAAPLVISVGLLIVMVFLYTGFLWAGPGLQRLGSGRRGR